MKVLKATSFAMSLLLPFSAMAQVPSQFIAKQYTELLGRVPDPSGFQNAATNFASTGCSLNSLYNYGLSLFTPGGEFTKISYYGPQEQVLLAYRAIVNTEPDNNYSYFVNAVSSGSLTIQQVAQELYGSSAFSNLVPYICNNYSYGFGSANGSNFVPSMPPRLTRGQFMDQDALQQQLLGSSRGQTLALPLATVVVLTHPLLIPSGTTLTTSGAPTVAEHALMARLVRGAAFNDELVKVCPDVDYVVGYTAGTGVPSSAANPNDGNAHCNYGNTIRNGGGKLTYMWVDGERGGTGSLNGSSPVAISYRPLASNIHIYGGLSTQVSNNFIAGNDGSQGIVSWGSYEIRAFPCGGSNNSSLITGNLVTGYASRHSYAGDSGTAADGITNGCEGSTIQNNSIVDASDAGIVVSRACPATQHSQVTYNVVFSAGNSYTTAIGASAFFPDPSSSTSTCLAGDFAGADGRVYPSFAGTNIQYNQYWSGNNTHFLIGISVGDRAYSQPNATSSDHNSYAGDGGTTMNVSNNGTNGVYASSATNILEFGMLNVNIQGNSGSQRTANSFYTVRSNCPTSSYLLTVATGNVGSTANASGSFQSYAPVAVANTGANCLSEINPGPSQAALWPGYYYGY